MLISTVRALGVMVSLCVMLPLQGGVIIVTSASRSIDVDGTTSGPGGTSTYGDSRSTTAPSGSYDTSVGGSVIGASSNASLQSNLDPTFLSVNSRIFTSASAPPGSTSIANAHSDFDVSFRVNDPTPFVWTGQMDYTTIHGYLALSLTSSLGSYGFSWQTTPQNPYYHFSTTGILQPGIVYTLRGVSDDWKAVVNGSYDAGGLTYTMRLQSVPEFGHSWWLLLLAVGACAALRRTTRAGVVDRR